MKTRDFKSLFGGKTVLVTGGAGSIGSELVRALVERGEPKSVRVFDNNETALFELEQRCAAQASRLRIFVGDVRDKERVARAMEGVDIVFHAAALKHVYINEYTPGEAVKTNVMGTQNVIDAAMECNVERMINISTDKAVDPTSVMGTTKLLAEKLVTAANYSKGSRRCVFASVRFGNVLASRGSVVPLFMEQISKGGPLTITRPEMTRFFMSVENAVSLIFKAAEMAKGGEVFILRMPSVRIGDLADVMVQKYAGAAQRKPSEIKIRIIGPKKGEKTHESLLSEHEQEHARAVGDDLIVLDPAILPHELPAAARAALAGAKGGLDSTVCLHSSKQKPLSKDEIGKLLDEAFRE
ncbi:MAG: polysaccharide biosynthesis protein [Candidatus Marsarchaeota archaeon]|nr:polysaccharide biosynthesis protein [Candidatus Marsarchaeota archaeon]